MTMHWQQKVFAYLRVLDVFMDSSVALDVIGVLRSLSFSAHGLDSLFISQVHSKAEALARLHVEDSAIRSAFIQPLAIATAALCVKGKDFASYFEALLTALPNAGDAPGCLEHVVWVLYVVLARDSALLHQHLDQVRSFVDRFPRDLLAKHWTPLANEIAASRFKAEDDSEWLAPPLVTGLQWSDATEESIRGALMYLVKAGDLAASGMALERARCAQPSFYPGCTLYEAQLRLPDQRRGILYFVSKPDLSVSVFTGSSGPIHAMNDAGLLVIPTGDDGERRVEEYLGFFCATIWGDDGPFPIVRCYEDILFEGSPSDEEAKRLKRLIRLPKVVRQRNGTWRADAAVLYAGALSDATLRMTADGQVSMIRDTLLAKGLPVVKMKMDLDCNLRVYGAAAASPVSQE